MLTQAAFVQQLTTQNRWIYLGGPSCVRTQSSTLGLVAAVLAYQGVANSANLLQVLVEIHNLPPAKKIRYAASIEALQRSMPHPIYVTPLPFTLHAVPVQGIGIPRTNPPDPADHQTNVVMALRQLHATAAGQLLMTAICNQIGVNGRRAAIHPWNAQQTNNCYCTDGDAGKTNLALSLEFAHGAVGAAIQSCLNGMGHAGVPGYTWLSGQVDACPIYALQGVPSIIASSTVHGGGWISPATIQAWATGAVPFPGPLVGGQVQDAQVVLGTVLAPGATAGAGSHTGVRWNASSTQFTDTAGNVQLRPPYIALGHELIHAYHNMCGDQTGHEIGTYSRVLYEYLCIGLGPWAGHAHTENGLRLSAALAQRTLY